MKYCYLMLFAIVLSFVYIFTARSQGLDTSLPLYNRDIYLRGEINEAMAFKIGEEIASLNASGDSEITLHITSPGGEVYAGLMIYDYMMESKAPIRTSCEGYCMSMGAYLLASGTTRQSSAHATIMLHQVGSRVEGKINEMLEELSESQRLQGVLNEILSKRSGLTTTQLDKIEDHDNFMTPEEAKTLNLIDVVVGQ